MISRASLASTVAVVLLLSVAFTGCANGQDAAADEVETLYAAASVTDAAAAARQARDTAILEWAAEEGAAETFSASELMSAYRVDVDERGAATNAAGSAATQYGAQTLSWWNYYTEHVEMLAQSLRSSILTAVTEAEARAYYDAHPAEFARQDVLTVRVTEWEGARAFGSSELTIDADTVRTLQEADDLAVSAALDLAAGEQTSVDRGDGRQALIECLTRDDAGIAPFDEVVQAAAMRVASDAFEAELERRIDNAHP